MAEKYIYKICNMCEGDGVFESINKDGETIEVPCSGCDGKGKTLFGELHNNLFNKHFVNILRVFTTI